MRRVWVALILFVLAVVVYAVSGYSYARAVSRHPELYMQIQMLDEHMAERVGAGTPLTAEERQAFHRQKFELERRIPGYYGTRDIYYGQRVIAIALALLGLILLLLPRRRRYLF